MKIGVLADIHANLPALRATLSAARTAGVERLLIAGDLVGYYYWPAECFDLLAGWPHDMVVGNHEEMLRAVVDDVSALPPIRLRYGSGINVARETLGARIAPLLARPSTTRLTIDGREVLLCHGSPSDTDQYVYPDAPESVRREMAVTGAEFVFFGHTHYPVQWQIGYTVVANPGSVGQPRDRRPGAQWLLWDTTAATMVHRREPYDIDRVVRECAARDPGNPYLAAVLTRS